MDNSRNKQNSDQQAFFEPPRVDIPSLKDREPGEPTIYQRNKALNPYPTFSEAAVTETYEQQMGGRGGYVTGPSDKVDVKKEIESPPRRRGSGRLRDFTDRDYESINFDLPKGYEQLSIDGLIARQDFERQRKANLANTALSDLARRGGPVTVSEHLALIRAREDQREKRRQNPHVG